MAVRHSVFDHPFRAIVHHPVISELGIKLRAKARSKETIAKKTARRVQDKNLELRLRNRESMRPGKFCEHADDDIHIFDVVNHAAIQMSQTVVDRATVIFHLSFTDHFGRVAAVLAITFTQNADQPPLLSQLGGVLRQMGIGKIVKAG
jgi:hypothetical protein